MPAGACFPLNILLLGTDRETQTGHRETDGHIPQQQHSEHLWIYHPDHCTHTLVDVLVCCVRGEPQVN